MRSRKTQIAIILCLLLLPLIGLTASAVLSSGSTNYFSIFVSSGGNTGGSGLLAKDVTEFSRLSDTHYGLQWSPPPGWAVSNVNITLSNITAPTYERVIEDYADQAVPLIQYNYTNPFQSLILAGIMSFNLTPGEPVYFNKLSLLLVKAPFNESAYVDIAIYNATYNSSLNWVVPDQPLWTVSNQSLIGDTLEFKNFSLTASPDQYLVLDPHLNQTYDNANNDTYFIVAWQDLSTIPKASIYWFYANDTSHGDNGYAYWASFNIFGQLVGITNRDPYYNDTFDLCSKLYFNPNNVTAGPPLPSDVGLEINGTSVNNIGPGSGWWSTSGNLSGNSLFFNVSTDWNSPVSYNATFSVTYQDVALAALTQTFVAMSFLYANSDNQSRSNDYLLLFALGSVAVAGAGGYTGNKRRTIPRNALRSLEHIIVDHNSTGVLIWTFDFVSMEQDVALVSGFMSAIKSFLEEMKVGGLKRLSTEFGTFIREESQLLTATCITSDIGLNEELWIRGKLHSFLTQVEQMHRQQLEGWKGDVGQFRESFPSVLGSVIDLDRVNELHKQKVVSLSRKKKELQGELNKYGAQLEEMKANHDSGKLSDEEYTIKRLKTEFKYDQVQKDYIYASLFLSKAPTETAVTPKAAQELEEIQKRFMEIRLEIDELRKKEVDGTITQEDRVNNEKLQKELMRLVDRLDKIQKR
ncbi:MAG: hypothetical protein WED07_00895 [Candidatus Freyarchaeum deiterrae]